MTTAPEIRTAIIEGRGRARDALAALVKGTPGYRLAGLFDSTEDARDGLDLCSPEVVLLCLEAQGKPARRIRELKDRYPSKEGTLPTRLSGREQETLRRLAAGHSYKTAAAELGVSVDTVRFHVRNIYEKLHVHSKLEAVLKATREGLVP